jgi:O-antigen ligase
MNERLITICTVLYGLALGSMTFSKAAFSVFGGLAVILSLPLLIKQPRLSCVSFVIPFFVFIGSLLLATALAPESSEPWKKIDGLWPFVFLFSAAAIGKKTTNPHHFLYVLLAFGGLSGLYSMGMALDWLPSHKVYSPINVPPTHIMASAVILTTILPLAVDTFFRYEGKKKLFFLAIALLTLFGLMSTQQRANLGIGCILAALIPFFHLRESKTKVLVAIALFVAIPFVFHFAGERTQGIFNFDLNQLSYGDEVRLAHWEVAWDSWKDKPFFGHGLGSYSQLALNNITHGEYLEYHILHGHFAAHNYPLHVLATQGIFGLLIVSWFAWSVLWAFLNRFQENRQAAILGILAWLIFVGTSFTDTPMYQSVRLAAFTIITGFAYGLLNSQQNSQQNSLD